MDTVLTSSSPSESSQQALFSSMRVENRCLAQMSCLHQLEQLACKAPLAAPLHRALGMIERCLQEQSIKAHCSA
jgi:hypothetical protein